MNRIGILAFVLLQGCFSHEFGSLTAGEACTTNINCGTDANGNAYVCAGLFGAGQVCTAQCFTDDDCGGHCCGMLANGLQVCVLSVYCEARTTNGTGCSKNLGDTCSSDADCCPYVDSSSGSRFATVCDSPPGQPRVCRGLCASNSGCQSNCCAAGAVSGFLVCSPSSACGG